MNQQISFYEAKLEYEIDSADLYALLQSKESIIVIDARSGTAYENEHIPGALSLPHLEMNKKRVQDLCPESLYVSYCDGIGCNASTKGAYKLARLGFRVKELIGGLDWWKKDGYSTEGKNSSRSPVCGGCSC
ncbi:rhodanese-like domain-containing protein [Maridesulfovibrio sp.]|uniref:rhodanese-like domain-containing protein n=1 Tax=Maridesulfovibrio sp. TaxID=2795000 RepID=UPI0029F4EA23|nr:rhodanese-like domain-containing protein [Maridesulfovibrio sp.]